MKDSHHHIGIDLGGTKTEAIVLDDSEKVLFSKRIATPRIPTDPGAEYGGIVNTVVDLIDEVLDSISNGAGCTIGLGIPGSVEPGTGLVQNANTTCLIGRPFQHDLENRLGRAVAVENDANCFTLAEALQGAGKGSGVVFGVIMGTGCGGGISIQGHLHRGRHLIAGEWGHFSVDPRGAECYCGNTGCVETKISGGGVEQNYYRTYGRRLTMQEITRGYRQGDTSCRKVFEQFIDDFGRCLGGLISTLDPDAVVLGGGLSNIEELYTLGAEAVHGFAFHNRIKTPILKHFLGDAAGVYGAAWIGKQRLDKGP